MDQASSTPDFCKICTILGEEKHMANLNPAMPKDLEKEFTIIRLEYSSSKSIQLTSPKLE